MLRTLYHPTCRNGRRHDLGEDRHDEQLQALAEEGWADSPAKVSGHPRYQEHLGQPAIKEADILVGGDQSDDPDPGAFDNVDAFMDAYVAAKEISGKSPKAIQAKKIGLEFYARVKHGTELDRRQPLKDLYKQVLELDEKD